MAIYQIEVYTTATGSRPFSDWLQRLPDRRAQARLLARLDRVAGGNLGDWRPIVGADGLAELRDPYGPGLRIYFGFDAAKIIVLLGGSTKRDQQRAISRAKLAWADYQARIGVEDASK